MRADKDLYGKLRNLDVHDLRRVLIFVRGLLLARGDERGAQPDSEAGGRVSYRREFVNCGKPGCSACPHGPYWYAYYREGGKLVSRYIGKEPPTGAGRAGTDEREVPG